MKLTDEQYEKVKLALLNNSVDGSLKIWYEDGDLTEGDLYELITEIFEVL